VLAPTRHAPPATITPIDQVGSTALSLLPRGAVSEDGAKENVDVLVVVPLVAGARVVLPVVVWVVTGRAVVDLTVVVAGRRAVFVDVVVAVVVVEGARVVGNTGAVVALVTGIAVVAFGRNVVVVAFGRDVAVVATVSGARVVVTPVVPAGDRVVVLLVLLVLFSAEVQKRPTLYADVPSNVSESMRTDSLSETRADAVGDAEIEIDAVDEMRSVLLDV
jgi:hypothetical protein